METGKADGEPQSADVEDLSERACNRPSPKPFGGCLVSLCLASPPAISICLAAVTAKRETRLYRQPTPSDWPKRPPPSLADCRLHLLGLLLAAALAR